MKYSPADYANAFAELALDARTDAEQEKLVKSFWAAVEKNGDVSNAPKIAAVIDATLRRADGRDLWEIYTARKLPQDAHKILADVAKPNDIIKEHIDPELVAGVRIVKNGEEQLDTTLKHRLDALFQA